MVQHGLLDLILPTHSQSQYLATKWPSNVGSTHLDPDLPTWQLISGGHLDPILAAPDPPHPSLVMMAWSTQNIASGGFFKLILFPGWNEQEAAKPIWCQCCWASISTPSSGGICELMPKSSYKTSSFCIKKDSQLHKLLFYFSKQQADGASGMGISQKLFVIFLE